MEPLISAAKVEGLFSVCLCEEGEGSLVQGVVRSVRLNTAGREDDIRKMLDGLPDAFRASKGGGWSFLNACNDSAGVQWTGMHKTVEELVLLGIAAGLVQFTMPRNLWTFLPGSMPYFVYNDQTSMTAR